MNRRAAAASTMLMKTYAIGDLQGCSHEAQILLERIFEDAGGPAAIVFVGGQTRVRSLQLPAEKV